MCSYLVKGDDTMKDVNKIHITVRNIDKAEVWVSQVSQWRGYISEGRDLRLNGDEEIIIP